MSVNRAGRHLVHFYADEQELAETVAPYIVAALRSDGVAVVTATRRHRLAVEAELRVIGFDLVAARAGNSYLTYDAETVLRHIMVGGRPDRDRVLLRDADGPDASSRGPLFAYGEIAPLLWRDRMIDAALELEEFLNDFLIEGDDVTLLCGYPRSLSETGTLDAVRRLCMQHTYLTSLPLGP